NDTGDDSTAGHGQSVVVQSEGDRGGARIHSNRRADLLAREIETMKIISGGASLPSRKHGWETHLRPKHALSGMRGIVGYQQSTQARRHRKYLITINRSLAETARWKRRVPRGFSAGGDYETDTACSHYDVFAADYDPRRMRRGTKQGRHVSRHAGHN